MKSTPPLRTASTQPVLIITGMHRSATSLMTSLCQSAGLHIGERLMSTNAGNSLGHFEDLDFYEFHKRVLRANGCCQDGFVTNATVKVPDMLRADATRLINARHSVGQPWGWKDPRTVLFLSFWKRQIPGAHYLFLFRSPWEVIDSLFRRGVHEFLHTNPASVLDIWMRYNRDIKAFVQHNPSTCLLFESSQVINQPRSIVAAVRQQTGIALTEPDSLYRDNTFTTLTGSPRETFIREFAPQAVELYDELRTLATGGAAPPTRKSRRLVGHNAAVFEQGMHDWWSLHDQQRQLAQLRNATAAAESTLASLQQQIDALNIRSVQEQADLAASREVEATLRATATSLESQLRAVQPIVADHATLTENISFLQDSIASYHSRLTEKLEEIARLESEKVNRTAVIDKLNAEIALHLSSLSSFEDGEAAARAAAAALESQLDSLSHVESENTQLKETIAALEVEVAHRDSRLVQLRQSLTAVEKSGLEHKQAFADLLTRATTLESELTAARALAESIPARERAFADLLTRATTLESELTAARSLAESIPARERAFADVTTRVTTLESELTAARALAASLPSGEATLDSNERSLQARANCVSQSAVPTIASATPSLLRHTVERHSHDKPASRNGSMNGNGHLPGALNGRSTDHNNGNGQPPLTPATDHKVSRASKDQGQWKEHQGILRPLSGLKAVSATATTSLWEMTDCDPHFTLSFPELPEVQTGYYELVVELPEESRSPRPFWRPRLYVDYGSGFREEDAVVLTFRECPTGVVCTLLLRLTARNFRFDPSERPGPLHIGRVLMKRISRARYYNGAVRRLIARKAGSPYAAWSAIKRTGTVLRRGGVRGLAAAVRQADLREPAAHAGYSEWVALYDTPSKKQLADLHNSIETFAHRPRISVVMPVYNTPIAILDAAIHSVRRQIYPDWELCIADDASPAPGIRKLLNGHAAADDRIKICFRPDRGNITVATNAALDMATGEFVALLDHDDVLPEHALYWVAEAINRRPDAAILYSDEDKLDAANKRYDPYFKGDFNPDLLRSQNMISHLGVYRRDIVAAVGGLRPGFDGAQDHDFALRATELVRRDQIVHIPRILYHWRAISGSTAVSVDAKPAAVAAGRRAVADHLRRIGSQATVEPAPESPAHHRIRHPLPSALPRVSIVICTRDHEQLLRTAISSIQLRTTYGNYDIVVCDNGSVDAGTTKYLAEIATLPAVTVFRDDSPFNYSRLNNTAVARSTGELVCLLNDDIEVVTPEWLDELASFAIQPDVGAVGARLWYPDRTLQHGGVIIGIGGVAGHGHLRLPKGRAGYFSRAALQQELSAVTGACLMVRRKVFDEVGGLDEQIAVAFNDIDFCLRLRRAGYRNIWTPFSELIHHESASRGYEDNPEKLARFQREVRFMQSRWGNTLLSDPHYNPNLSISAQDFSLAWPPRQ